MTTTPNQATSPSALIPDRRFRPEPMNATEAIAWLQSHRYIWYHAPMDFAPRKLWCKSKLKLWKRSPGRFEVSVELPADFGYRPETLRIDNTHLSRLVLPFELWHHGITASVSHVKYVGHAKRSIVLHQSNGYHLEMSSLSHAINFAKRQAMQLSVHCGRRQRILVPAHPPISGERNF